MLLSLLLILVIVFLLIPSMDSFTLGKGRTMNPAVRYWLSGALFLVMITTPFINMYLAPVFLDGEALRMGGFLIGVAYDVLALIAVIIIAKVTSTPVRTDETPVPPPSSASIENEEAVENGGTEELEDAGETVETEPTGTVSVKAEEISNPLDSFPPPSEDTAEQIPSAPRGKPVWMLPAVVVGVLTLIVAGAYLFIGKANSTPAYTFTAVGSALTSYPGSDAPVNEEVTSQEYKDNDYVNFVNKEYLRISGAPAIRFTISSPAEGLDITGYRSEDTFRYVFTTDKMSIIFYASPTDDSLCGRRIASLSEDTLVADKDATWQCAPLSGDVMFGIISLLLKIDPVEGVLSENTAETVFTIDSTSSPSSLTVTAISADGSEGATYSYEFPDGDTVRGTFGDTPSATSDVQTSIEITAGTVTDTLNFSDLKRR